VKRSFEEGEGVDIYSAA